MKNRKVITLLLVGVLGTSTLLAGCKGTGGEGTKPQAGTEKPQKKESGAALKPKEESTPVTVERLAEYLVSAGGDYNSATNIEILTSGMNKTANATKEQCLTMISMAFGPLPEPTGNNARVSDKDVVYSDIPNAAKEHIDNLIRGGVLTNTEDGKLHPTKEASIEEARTIVRRIYTLFGSDLKDDYYSAVNKEALDNKEIPAGESDTGTTYDLRQKVERQVQDIIVEIAAGSGYEQGSMEQKIKDLYKSALAFDKRNEAGVEPLRKYLDALEQAENLEELSKSQVLTLKEAVAGGLFSYMYMTDFRDTDRKVATVTSSFNPLYKKEDYKKQNSKDIKAAKELHTTLLTLSGESPKEAEENVDNYLKFEEKLLKYKPDEKTYQQPDKANKIVSIKELQNMMPGIDVKALMEAKGYDISKEINIMDPSVFQGFCELLQDEENLEAIKTGIKISILSQHYTNLSEDFRQAFDKYNQEAMGQTADNSTPKEVAGALVKSSLGGYLDRFYVEKHFSPEAKQNVEEMIREFIEVYKERVNKLDWMSEETKQKAREKLDSMKFLIGYPDEWEDNLQNLEIGEDFFKNQVEITKLQIDKQNKEAKEVGTGGTRMNLPLTEVNAYYDQFSNTMCFPAAILQAPNYDINASREENLAAIGTVIAHEITHAFDDKGAKYGPDGNEVEWWTKEDYQKFEERCRQVEKFYDGWEAAPGIAISGKQTLSENIADIGGVACTLEVLKKYGNPNYDKFFRAYAVSWLKCTTRERAEAIRNTDEHSPNSLRVNRVLSNFQEFADTYGLQEGDGMYIPADKRIIIW